MLTTNQELLSGFRAARIQDLSSREARRLVELLSTSLEGAHSFVSPASADGETDFFFWMSSFQPLDNWVVFSPLPFVIVRWSEACPAEALSRWAPLMAQFKRPVSMRCVFHDSGSKDVPESGSGPRLQLVLSQDSPSQRLGVEYLFDESWDRSSAASLARKFLDSWPLPAESVRIRPVERDGFDIEPLDPRIRIYKRAWETDPTRPFPRKLRVDWLDSIEEGCRVLKDSMTPLFGFTGEFLFQGQVAVSSIAEFQPVLDRWSEAWNYSLTGQYASKFDPFRRPKDLTGPTWLRYPVLGIADCSKNVVRLQVDVVHTPEASFLEFLSSGGQEMLDEYLQIARDQSRVYLEQPLTSERWNGPFPQRWREADD